MAFPWDHPTPEDTSEAGRLPPQQPHSFLNNWNLDQIHSNAESESSSLALHSLVQAYLLGPGVQV